MRCAGMLIALLIGLTLPAVATAADLAFAGSAGTPAEQAAAALRGRTQTFDRIVALASSAAVVDAVKSGQVAGGVILAIADSGVPSETATVLLSALQPVVHILGATRVIDREGSPLVYWLIAKAKERANEQHSDRLVVSLEAPADSKAFSLVVAALSKLGFTVNAVAFTPLPGKPFGFRYLLVLSADKPVLILRVTDTIARDSRTGGGRAVLIGAWKQVP